MKKKIKMQFILVSLIAIILTKRLSVGTFYELFVQEMRNDMKAYTHVLRSAGVFNASNEEKLNLKNEDLRITIIDADGTVVYDNEANDIEMDNHKDRPEIESALKNGEGSDVSKSSTLNMCTYFYAVLLDDGQVLRIAKEASSVWNIFIKVLPLILGIIILMLFSVGIITHYITKSIVKPVEELANNIDEIKEIKTYKEIQPFIDTIKKQHEDIVKNSHVRQEFTANVSHELKTPLTSISGYSELNENADVIFAFRGITPRFCVKEAIHGMKKKRVIIVPSLKMKLAVMGQKLLPSNILMKIVAKQQKKKTENS